MKTFKDFLDIVPPLVLEKLEFLKSIKERNDFHPEESTFEHIKIVTERLILTGELDLIISGLFHDLGKADSVKINEKTGNIQTPGHELKSFLLIEQNNELKDFIKEIGANLEVVKFICKNHGRFHQLGEMRETKRKIFLDEMISLGIFEKMEIFARADDMLTEFKHN